MTSTGDSGKASGTKGSPQTSLENFTSEAIAKENSYGKDMVYSPTPKHEDGGWGSPNPIKSQEEGQELLDTGYKDKKQVYNITKDKKLVKFQPANTPNNEYHAYEVSHPRDIPSVVMKKMLNDGVISKSDYNKLRKGKKK